MNLQIGERASPTFAEPMALMSDCHRRVERFLGLLLRVTREAAGGDLGRLHREALESALRYFAEAAPRHTADEEVSLFPRLRAAGSPEALAVLEKVRALEADHEVAGASHRIIDQLGRRWLDAGRLEPAELADLRSHLTVLEGIYGRHIAVEDHEVFPVATRVLSPAEVEAVGREMAARRGQAFAAPARLGGKELR